MLIRDYRTQFVNQLESVYDRMEVEQFFYLALYHFHGLSRIDLAMNPKFEFSQLEISTFDNVVERLKVYVPIQYILGKSHFCGLEFTVTDAVLIPRPETEELVQWIVESISQQNINILDIGTGSGCIAISLASKIQGSKVDAWDVSQDALSIAVLNAKANNVQVDFKLVDVLKEEPSAKKYNVIVSNPPYVRNLEKHEISNNVLDYEPHLALFVDDDDALIFYRKIADLASKMLAPNGYLFFEINQYLGQQSVDLLTKMGFQNIELRKDIYGNDRMIKCDYS